MSITRHFYAIAGIATLLTASGLATSRSHSVALFSNPQPVAVTNGSSNPVPTVAQGTTQIGGTVAVSSLPAVQIASGQTVGVSGTVNIGSNQTIGISGEPTVRVGSGETIGINNTCSNPIPVSVDCPRSPVFAQGVIHLTDGSFFNTAHVYTVPVGKRLVIQTIFGQANLQPGQKVPEANIGMYPVPFTDRGAIDSTEEWSDATSQVDYYFSGGASVDIEGHRSDGIGTGVIVIGFSGYLVAAPGIG